MVGMGAAIPIAHQSIVADHVLVRTRLPFFNGHRRDARRKPTDPRLEDALWSVERRAFTVDTKPRCSSRRSNSSEDTLRRSSKNANAARRREWESSNRFCRLLRILSVGLQLFQILP